MKPFRSPRPDSENSDPEQMLDAKKAPSEATPVDEDGFYAGPPESRHSVHSRQSAEDRTRHAPRTSNVFVDAEAMKAKLRQSMVKPEYDVGDFYHKEGWCQVVARSGWFEKATLSVIAFNALWIAIDTDMNKATMLIDAHPVFQFAEHGFCIYFTWEWVIRFCAFRRKRDGVKDAWFCFDSCMVFMMVSETWVMGIVMLSLPHGSVSGGNTGSLRLLRLLRLSRMARMAKLLNSVPELLILIKGMASATRSVVVTLLLLFLLIYVFSIAFRQLTDGSPVGMRYFPDMWVAMHTLWIDGTLLDGPGSVVTMLLDESIIYVLIFYLFVLMAALTVMNMLIGVLCEVVSAVAATEREQITMSTVKEGFEAIIHRGGLDTDGDQMISRAEFVGILEDPEAVTLLNKVDVDVYAFVDLADFLFEEEDGEDEVRMSFGDFMETVLSLRGSNTATVKDIVDLRKFIKTQFCASENREQRRRSSIVDTEALSAHAALAAAMYSKEPVLVTPPELLGVVPSGGPPKSQGPCSPTPVPPISLGGHTQLWVQAAEMQGVLAATRSKLERFVSSLPQAADANPATAEQPRANIEDASTTVGDGLPLCGLLKEQRHPPSGRGQPWGSGSTTASLTAPTTVEWSPGPLPGMVRYPVQLPKSEEDACNGYSMLGEARRGSASSHEAAAAAPDGHRAAQLPSRLAELRLHLQQLERYMEAGAEELRAVQELF